MSERRSTALAWEAARAANEAFDTCRTAQAVLDTLSSTEAPGPKALREARGALRTATAEWKTLAAMAGVVLSKADSSFNDNPQTWDIKQIVNPASLYITETQFGLFGRVRGYPAALVSRTLRTIYNNHALNTRDSVQEPATIDGSRTPKFSIVHDAPGLRAHEFAIVKASLYPPVLRWVEDPNTLVGTKLGKASLGLLADCCNHTSPDKPQFIIGEPNQRTAWPLPPQESRD